MSVACSHCPVAVAMRSPREGARSIFLVSYRPLSIIERVRESVPSVLRSRGHVFFSFTHRLSTAALARKLSGGSFDPQHICKHT